MSIRKNPDWYVWAGDVLYWIRTPPGIYIFIIFVLLSSLAVALNQPRPATYSAPTSVNPAPPIPSQQQVSTPSPVIRADTCPVGMVFVQHLATCIPGHRRTTTIFVAGSKNDCPDDAIFIDRFARCIPMYSVGNYKIFAGDVFYISDRRSAYVYVRAGQIQIYNAAANFNRYKSPSDQPAVIRAGAMVTGIADRSSIRVEFDATPN